MSEGMLLDIGMVAAQVGQLVSIRKTATSDRLEQILQFIREGRAYVLIATTSHPDGALRGQIVSPMCLEGELVATRALDNVYGFGNVLISPDMADQATATLIQYAPGVREMTATMAVRGSSSSISLASTYVNVEAKPTDAQYSEFGDVTAYLGQKYSVSTGMGAAYTALKANMYVGVAVADAEGQRMQGNLTEARHCRRLLGVEDNLFSLAQKHGNDWLTVWSMNPGNPDTRKTLEPRYFAHPFEVTLGETLDSIMRRFGMTKLHLQAINPTAIDLVSLAVGSTLCVIPDWSQTVGGNGARTCVF
mmetsp:Transcript_16949/g.40866  ORF Transcript_16949/g.40866 Transcript_16949/m.40866 type:complete len:305 (+) Transcript_16949:43-957(+)